MPGVIDQIRYSARLAIPVEEIGNAPCDVVADQVHAFDAVDASLGGFVSVPVFEPRPRCRLDMGLATESHHHVHDLTRTMSNDPGNNNGYPWQNGYPWPGMGMQRIFVVSSSVPAGPVSLRVHNSGALTHEVMVLPLNPNQYPGQWAIGTNNQLDETGSLAEASRSCGADAGDGVLAGATAWTTVNLPPGRYELLCKSQAPTGLACTPNWTRSAIGNPSLGLPDSPPVTNLGAMPTRQHNHPATPQR